MAGEAGDRCRRNLLADPRFGEESRLSPFMKHVVVEALRLLRGCFFPPLAYAAHVVRGGGAHRAPWVMGRISELLARILGHALNVEGENHRERSSPQARSQESFREILGAGEHVGGVDNRGQLPHGLAIPEVIVAMIIEIVVKPVETPALIVVEGTVGVRLLRRDAGDTCPFPVRILE